VAASKAEVTIDVRGDSRLAVPARRTLTPLRWPRATRCGGAPRLHGDDLPRWNWAGDMLPGPFRFPERNDGDTGSSSSGSGMATGRMARIELVGSE
jgi:hypothetical protein